MSYLSKTYKIEGTLKKLLVALLLLPSLLFAQATSYDIHRVQIIDADENMLGLTFNNGNNGLNTYCLNCTSLVTQGAAGVDPWLVHFDNTSIATEPTSASASGTLSATSSDCSVANSCVQLDAANMNSWTVDFTQGTSLSGTIQFEKSKNGTNWTPSFCYNANQAAPSPFAASNGSAGINSAYQCDATGFDHFRARVSAYSAGNTPVILSASKNQYNIMLENLFALGIGVNPGFYVGIEQDDVGLTKDTTLAKLTLAQASTTAAQTGPLIQAATTTSAPSYTTAKTNPLSTDTSGNLRVLAGSGSTTAVTGNVTVVQPTGTNLHVVNDASSAVIGHVVADSGSTTAVTQATASNLNAQVVGSIASASTDSGNPVKIGGKFNTTQPTVTDGQRVDAQMTSRGAQIIAKGVDGFSIDNTSFTATQATGTNLHTVVDSGSITANAGTNLNTSLLAKDASVANLSQTPGAALLNVPGVLGLAWATTSGQSITNSTVGALSVDLSSNLRTISGSGSTTAVTQTTASSLNATVVGTGTFATQSTIAASATNIAKAEDSSSADADVGVPALAVRKATPANTSGTDGDYEFLQMSGGRLWGSVVVDTALPAGTNLLGKISIDQTTPGTTNLVSLSAETTKVIGTTRLQDGSGTALTTTSSNLDTNVKSINGAAPLMGNGATGTGSQRVTIASDNTSFGVGVKTNNNAAPGATNVGTLNSLANAAPPTWTEGNQVALSQDLLGNLRVAPHPFAALGVYEVTNTSGGYAGVAAQAPLFAMRWGDATRLAIILRVRVMVVTTTAATTAGIQQRDLIIARGFTASDTGGTAVTLTGNNQKRRTSQGTSLVTDMRFGGPLTAGTRTLDSRPVATAYGWSGLLSTGFAIGGTGSSAVGAARSTEGSQGWVTLLDATNGVDSPIVLAQNEGVEVQIGKENAQPAGATNQTFVNILWAEANSY